MEVVLLCYNMMSASPNVYSRIHKVSGTKGSALKYPLPGKIAIGHEEWMKEEEYKNLEEKYTPPIVKKGGRNGKAGRGTWWYGFPDGLADD